MQQVGGDFREAEENLREATRVIDLLSEEKEALVRQWQLAMAEHAREKDTLNQRVSELADALSAERNQFAAIRSSLEGSLFSLEKNLYQVQRELREAIVCKEELKVELNQAPTDCILELQEARSLECSSHVQTKLRVQVLQSEVHDLKAKIAKLEFLLQNAQSDNDELLILLEQQSRPSHDLSATSLVQMSSI